MQANFNFIFSPERFSEEMSRLGTAKEVGERTDISAQTLSALKKGKYEATISTLAKIHGHYPSFDLIYILTGVRGLTELFQRVEALKEENEALRLDKNAYRTAVEKMGKFRAVTFQPKIKNLLRKNNPQNQIWAKGLKAEQGRDLGHSRLAS